MARLVLFTAVLLLAAAAHSIAQNLLPTRSCSRNSGDLDSCVKELLEGTRHFLINGSQDANIPSLEPFHVPEMPFSFLEGQYEVMCRNIEVHHLTDYAIDTVRVNEKEKLFLLALHLPHIELRTDFVVKSKVFALSMNATGKLEAHIRDCQVELFLAGELYQRDGDDFLRIRDVTVDTRIGSFTAQVTKMDNKILPFIMNSYFKHNMAKVTDSVDITFRTMLTDKLPTFANSLLALAPYHNYIHE